MSVGLQPVQDSANASNAMLQIWLLALSRAMYNLSRICVGPLLVVMAHELSYTQQQKGYLLSAFAAGYALTQVVGGAAADRVGGVPLLMMALLAAGGGLLILPFAAGAGLEQLWWLLWAMGVLQGPVYAASMVSVSRWTTAETKSFASSVIGAGTPTGSLLALGLTPLLVARLGWRVTSWTFGGGILLFAAFMLRYAQSAPKRSCMAMLEKLEKSSTPGASTQTGLAQQYLSLVSSPAVLAIFVAHSVQNFVRYFVVTWMPSYFNDVLHASPDATGLQLLLPELASAGAGLLSASWMRARQHRAASQNESTFAARQAARRCRQLATAVAFGGTGIGLAAMASAGSALSVSALLCLVQACSAMHGLGFMANYVEVTKHHSGMLVGVGNTLATVASYAAPMCASSVLAGTTGHSDEGYRKLFMLFAISNVVGILIYLPLCSTDPLDVSKDSEQAHAILDEKKRS